MSAHVFEQVREGLLEKRENLAEWLSDTRPRDRCLQPARPNHWGGL
jgi:hypothetical protein